MANDYQKIRLSGTTNGEAKKIAATATPGDTLHTATSDNTDNIYDEIWLWAYNSSSSAILLTIEFGGAAAPDQNIKVTIPSQSGALMVCPGLILKNGQTVKAFAGTTNVITVMGYINRITHS